MSLEGIKQWVRRVVGSAEAEAEAEGEEPVATPSAGANSDGRDDVERETSTNAQVEGAADEPWPGS
jgi:hypothetical protein